MRDLHQTNYHVATMRKEVAARQVKEKATVDAFHRLWYASPFTWGMTYWQNRPLLKCPMDLWTYQEIIASLKPNLIIETGTAFGGSALFFAHMLDLAGEGIVISIDIEPHADLPKHPRCQFVTGNSLEVGILDGLTARAAGQRVMVVLDSDHAAAHVTAELERYGPLVSPGQFLVVEDTNINGRPVPIQWKGGDGPGPAVDAWLPKHPEFAIDPMASRHFLTTNTWLRRAKADA